MNCLSINMSLLDRAIETALQAGKIIMPYFKSGTQRMIKCDGTDVTEADIRSDKFIRQRLKELTPNIPIVSEEAVEAGNIPDVSCGEYWLVDPLDGTTPFINGLDTFCVLIAYIKDFLPVLGIAHFPATSETYYAEKGKGAFCLKNNVAERISFPTTPPTRPLVAGNETYDDRNILSALFQNIRKEDQKFSDDCLTLRIFQQKLNIAAYTNYGGGEWDMAANQIILEEMGGNLVMLREPFQYGNPKQKLPPQVFLSHAPLEFVLNKDFS